MGTGDAQGFLDACHRVQAGFFREGEVLLPRDENDQALVAVFQLVEGQPSGEHIIRPQGFLHLRRSV